MTDEAQGPIQPGCAYSLTVAARLLGVEPRYLKEHLIDTGELAVATWGQRLKAVMGHEIIRAIEMRMSCQDPDDEEDEKKPG